MTRVNPGQRVEHIVWRWEGSVTSIEGDMVNVKLDSGDRDRVPAAALRVVRKAPDARNREIRRAIT